MLTRRQDELFSHAARLALRGSFAQRDSEKPSALKPLLDNWGDIEALVANAPVMSRRIANRVLASAVKRHPIVSNGKADHEALRKFGLECVLLFKIGRGDNPLRYPLEFGDYY